MKIGSCFLVILLSFGLSSCGHGGDEPPRRGPAAIKSPEPVFSDEPAVIEPVFARDYLGAALELIGSARESIDITALLWKYDPPVREIQGALIEAADRGVLVRILLDGDADFNRVSLSHLTRSGIHARLDLPGITTHAKMMIVDGEAVLIGSTNFTGHSIDTGTEANLLVRSPEIAGYFEDFFVGLWEGRRVAGAREVSENLSAGYVDVGLRGVETPNAVPIVCRDYIPIARDLIESADERIDLVLYGMRRPGGDPSSPVDILVGSLSSAAERGVEVNVVLDTSPWNPGHSGVNAEAMDYLLDHGIDARFDSPDTVTHAKFLIVDGESLIIETNNWGYGGLRLNNEAGVLVRDRAVAGAFRDYFERIRAEARRERE